MLELVLAMDPFEKNTWEVIKTDDVGRELSKRFSSMPDGARLYLDNISEECDITPRSKEGVEALSGLTEGRLFFVNYPAGPVALILIAVVAAVAVSLLLIPKVSVDSRTQRNQRQGNSRDSLTARTNEPRPLQRVPDIYGSLRAIPDMIAPPLTRFVGHREVEVSQLILGRGEFDIDDIRDGETPLSSIAGSSIQVYAPGTSASTRLSNGDTPQLSVGTTIEDGHFTPKRLNEVNGQLLMPPNNNTFSSASNILFIGPDQVALFDSTDAEDFADYFAPGDPVSISNAAFDLNTIEASAFSNFSISSTFQLPRILALDLFVGDAVTIVDSDGSVNDLSGSYTVSAVDATNVTFDSVPAKLSDWTAAIGSTKGLTLTRSARTVAIDLSGSYTVTTASSSGLVLDNPSVVNSDWLRLSAADDFTSQVTSASITTISSIRWTDQFFLGSSIDFEELVLNFVAPQGLYKDDGAAQVTELVEGEIELVTCDEEGELTASSSTTTHSFSLKGSAISRVLRAITVTIAIDPTKFYLIRARRTSDTDRSYEGTVVDEIRWRDCFGVKKHPTLVFPEATSMVAQTLSTAGAQALKDRKLNMLVSRKIASRNSSGEPGALAASSSPREIVPAIYEDLAIGAGSLSDIDFQSLSDACLSVENYFGTSLPLVYANAFTAAQVSIEEMITSVCETCFIRAYRNGEKLTFKPDTPEQLPRLLFNHRNKKPNSEKRALRFGVFNDHDGVKLTWQNLDGEPEVVELPHSGLRKPKDLKLEGISSTEHAQLHAWRAWNKMQYQNLSVSFDGLSECAFVSQRDAVLVADMTRSDTITGEVEAVDGLTLTIKPNRPLDLEASYACHLQFDSGVVQAIDVAAQTASSLVLASAPAFSLSTDNQNSIKATFVLVEANTARTATRVLVTKKSPKEGGVYSIVGINDDDRYYAQDRLFAVV